MTRNLNCLYEVHKVYDFWVLKNPSYRQRKEGLVLIVRFIPLS